MVRVNNLSFTSTEDDVRQHLASAGTITKVEVLTRTNGRPLGKAFVTFASAADAQNGAAQRGGGAEEKKKKKDGEDGHGFRQTSASFSIASFFISFHFYIVLPSTAVQSLDGSMLQDRELGLSVR